MFIDKDGKRVNIHATHTVNAGTPQEVTYPNLLDPAIRESLGITEIADPARPDEKYYFINETDEAPYVVATPKDIEHVRTLKIQEIRAHYEGQRAEFTNALAGATEQATWTKQESEARAFVANPAAITPFVDALLISRNIVDETKDVLCQKIIGKADAYAVAIGQSLGVQQAKEKAAIAATTIDELRAISW